MNTSRLNALGPDGFTWAQGRNPITDKHGNLIAFVQTSSRLAPVVRNASSGTWADPTMTGFQGPAGEVGTRVALAYVANDDVLHGIFMLSGSQTDAMIYYRRFLLVYSGTDLVEVVKDAAINLTLDKQRSTDTSNGRVSDGFDDIATGAVHPCALWYDDGSAHGVLVAAWGVNWDTGSAVGAIVVGTVLTIAMDATDGVATSWRALTGGSTIPTPSPTTHLPLVPHNQVNTATADPGFYGPYNVYPSLGINQGDGTLVVLWSDVTGSGHVGGLYARKAPRSLGVWALPGGAGNQKTLPKLVITGTDGGYDLKHEPITSPRYDPTNGRMWYGFTAWVDDTQGDCWCFGYLTNVGASGALTSGSGNGVVAYAAGAANCEDEQFVVGDVRWDTAARGLLVTFTNLLNHDVLVSLYSAAGALIDGPVTCYTAHPYDIPVITKPDNYVLVGRTFDDGARDSPPSFSGGPYEGVEITFAVASALSAGGHRLHRNPGVHLTGP